MTTKPRYSDTSLCDICGLPRSVGHRTGGHAKCSKIRQEKFAKKNREKRAK